MTCDGSCFPNICEECGDEYERDYKRRVGMLRTLGKTTWEKIEVGEVFAWNGCWCVLLKTNKNDALLLADTGGVLYNTPDDKSQRFYHKDTYLYKLPKSVQRLWKEE